MKINCTLELYESCFVQHWQQVEEIKTKTEDFVWICHNTSQL